VIGEHFGAVTILTADESGVYVMEEDNVNTLTRISPGAAAPLTLAHPAEPVAMAVYEHRVYWTDVSSTTTTRAALFSVDVDGGDVTTTYQSDVYLSRLAVGESSAFVGSPGNAIYRVPLAGGAPVAYDGLQAPQTFSLDRGTLFVSEESICRVKSVPVAGGEPTVLYEGTIATPFDDGVTPSCETQEVSAIAGNLIWQDLSEDWDATELKTMPEAGGTVRTLDGRYGDASGLVGDAANIYLSVVRDGHGHSLYKVPLDGGKAELLFQGLPPSARQLGRIAVDAHHVYFVEPVGDDESRILALPK